MIRKEGKILSKSGHKKGRQHDYAVCNDDQPQTRSQIENVLDLEFLGSEEDFHIVKYSLSVKRKEIEH